MKFVYFGYDFMLPAVRRLLEDGHELIGIFSFECDNIFNFNSQTMALADELGIPIILSKPEEVHIDSFIDKGCEVFLSAGYRYKIPPPNEQKAFSMNLHPSYLPKGRGLMPTPSIIMDHPEAGGLSLHKLTENFDEGDILYRERLRISETETVETYSARIAMRAPHILSKVMADMQGYWNDAEKQDESQASIFPTPDNEMRTLDWHSPVADIERKSRAFGYFGSLCRLEEELLVVYDLSIWKEQHDFEPGEIVHREARLIIAAASDGFVCLKNFQLLQEDS